MEAKRYYFTSKASKVQECTQYETERRVLATVSPELDLKVLLDKREDVDAMVKFFNHFPQLLA